MSKIAEQKALEAYPMVVSEQTISCRLSYSEGYDKAIQDFEEFLRKNNRGQLIRRFEDYIFKEKEEE